MPLLVLVAPFFQGTPAPPTNAAIPPLVWELVELSTSGHNPTTIADPSRYTMQFLPDGELAVGADCNAVVGTYELDGDTIRIKLSASTLALCPSDSQADDFLGVLERATAYAIDDDGQLRMSGDGSSLLLRPTLRGVVWEWQEFRGSNDSLVFPKNPRQYTIAFLPGGRLAIKADCNRAMGTYAVDGPRLELTIRGVTRALCAPGSLMNEYLGDLESVSSHLFRDGDLYLALRIDAGIMAFHARYVAPAAATPASG